MSNFQEIERWERKQEAVRTLERIDAEISEHERLIRKATAEQKGPASLVDHPNYLDGLRDLNLRKIREGRVQARASGGVTVENIFHRHSFEPYLAWSYAGHGWVEVRSNAFGIPPRRLCAINGGAETLIHDSLLQGKPPTGD
jgi:hypothetical protein